jgi:hypothetical protein
MKPIRSATSLALLIALAGSARAEDVPVRDGGSAQITVSARELTRIGMADGSKLGRVLAPDGVLDVHPGTDAAGKDTGDAFLRPIDPTPGKAFSFFVRDDRGATYTLVATTADVPSHTVLLHPVDPGPVLHGKPSEDKAEPYLRRIKALVRAMAGTDKEGNYSHQSIGQVVPVWQQTEAVLDSRWAAGSDLKAEAWTFRNATHDELRLTEGQFTGLYPDIRAVAVERQVLKAGEATRVFIVRGAAP